VTAQLGCYLRYASACPGEPDQSSDFLLVPLFWLRCFHGAALNPRQLATGPTSRHLGNLRVVPATREGSAVRRSIDAARHRQSR